jgi:hypothetical protein
MAREMSVTMAHITMRFISWQPRYPRTMESFGPPYGLLALSGSLDRWLCVPTFKRVCHKTVRNMHNRTSVSKGLHQVYL